MISSHTVLKCEVSGETIKLPYVKYNGNDNIGTDIDIDDDTDDDDNDDDVIHSLLLMSRHKNCKASGRHRGTAGKVANIKVVKSAGD